MRTVFKLLKDVDRPPEPGELIRSHATGDFINIVLSVSEIKLEYLWDPHRLSTAVRSVRYAKIFEGQVTYLNGERSRSFVWERSFWGIVEQYELVRNPNSQRRKDIMDRLKDVSTCWEKPT